MDLTDIRPPFLLAPHPSPQALLILPFHSLPVPDASPSLTTTTNFYSLLMSTPHSLMMMHAGAAHDAAAGRKQQEVCQLPGVQALCVHAAPLTG